MLTKPHKDQEDNHHKEANIAYEDLDDIDGFLSELKIPKQDFTPKTDPKIQPQSDEIDSSSWGVDQEIPESQPKPPITPEQKLAGAQAATELLDYAISFVALIIAGEGQRSDYCAKPEDKKMITPHLETYMGDKEIVLPSWLQLSVFIMIAYTPVIMSSLQKRKSKSDGKRLLDLEQQMKLYQEKMASINDKAA